MGEQEWKALIAAQGELAAVPGTLRDYAEHFTATAGQTIFRTGGGPSKVVWVLEGEIRLLRRSRNGAEIVLQRASAGFLAEASLDSPRYHCDAVAVVASRLLTFPIGRFREALEKDQRFRGFWMGRLAKEVRRLRSQCERLSLRSASDRIEHYIESEGNNGRLELSRTRKAWATELGLTHEALYRALAHLERTGKVETSERAGTLVLALSRARGGK